MGPLGGGVAAHPSFAAPASPDRGRTGDVMRSLGISAFLILLIAPPCIAADQRAMHALDALAPPLVEGFRDPNAIVYDTRRLALLDDVRGMAFRRLQMDGIHFLSITTPRGALRVGISNQATGQPYMDGPFHWKQLLGFLQVRLDRQLPPGLLANVQSDRAHEAWTNDLQDVIEIVGAARIEEAIPLLTKLLDDPELAMPAADALRCLGPRAAGAVQPLTRLLSKGDTGRPSPAAHALGAIGQAALPAVLAVASNPEDARRIDAIRAVAEIGPPAKAAVPLLIQLIRSPSSDHAVQRVALHALGEMGPAAAPAIPDLTSIVVGMDSDEAQIDAAAYALGRLGPLAQPALPALVKHMEEGFCPTSVVEAVLRMGPPGCEAIRSLSANGDFMQRKQFAEALTMVDAVAAGNAFPLMQDVLADADVELRKVAVDAIAASCSPETGMRALAERIDDPDPTIRASVIRALVDIVARHHLTPPAAVVARALRDDDASVREEAGILAETIRDRAAAPTTRP